MKKLAIIALLFTASVAFSQEETQEEKSNIQTYTPSKLLNKGQWDVKWFNGLYTQTKGADKNGNSVNLVRENFFTSTVEVFTGVSESNLVNIGAILEFRSNTFGGREALSVFSFDGRSGLSTIAPAIKFQPFAGVGNFSIQSSIHIPTFSEEFNADGFLDQSAWAFQNRLFYDYTFGGGDWQLFTDLTLEYNFDDGKSFAGNTYFLSPSVFVSYFPSSKTTILASLQQANRFGDFTQEYTALGLGFKYQVSKVVNLETIYSNFVRGTDNGLGQVFSLGMRALF